MGISRKRNPVKKTKSSTGKKVKFSKAHPKASKAIKIGIIVLVLLLFIGGGVAVGAFFGMFGDQLKIDEDSLVVKFENSTVYDADGNQIGTLSDGTKRKSISLNDMGDYLPKAYIAIEDERFYDHKGVDIGRTIYATVTYVLHGGSSKFGGSTITQQVVKNITEDKEKTKLAGVMRKIKEISKAFQVEKYLTKDQLLELYLNLIFVGGDDINGVELGANYYFNKSAKDLSIAECAYMAGINNSPNAYKPFAKYEGDENQQEKLDKMKEKINKRTKTVLAKMKELSYITDSQYDEACKEVDDGLKFESGTQSSATVDVSYVVSGAVEQLLNQIIEENEGINRDMAEMKLYSSGYKIYTTQKTSIQSALEEEIVQDKYITKQVYKVKNEETGKNEDKEQYSIPTMVIIDHKTGQVVAAATATGDKENRTAITKLGYLNYATSIKKQTGSSMKPIAVIAPGLESGKITGATVFDDCETSWGTWKPKNYDTYRGLINMRTAIEVSANIPHAKALNIIGPEKAVEFCEKVGLPNFEAEGLSLALGGLQEGISPLQLAAAYAAIANDGVYITPTFYTKVTDKEDNIVYEPVQEETRVMSEQNAYIEKDILTQPVLTGTATYCKIKGMQVSAKTGTTNDDNDRWLCGFTPYYTATCWYGYTYNATVRYSGNPAGKIWAAVMQNIHEELPNASFEEPDGIVRQSVCRLSGKLAGPACAGTTYTELFTSELLPKDICNGHTGVPICMDSGMLAVPECPNQQMTYNVLPEYEQNTPWSSNHSVALSEVPDVGAVCNIHSPAPGITTTDIPEEEHVHKYEITNYVPATCTKEGTRVNTCSCGDTYTEKVPLTNHNYENGKCLNCGKDDPSHVGTTPTNETTPTNTPVNPSTTNTVDSTVANLT